MTIKALLSLGPDELEKLSDEQLLEYLKPSIQVAENLKPASRSKSGVIDVSGIVERQAAKKESVEDFTKRMLAMAASLMEKPV